MAIIKIKSIQPVQAGSEWRIRVRMVTNDPTTYREQFRGIGAGYTMHQAQVMADSIRRDISNHGFSVLDNQAGE